MESSGTENGCAISLLYFRRFGGRIQFAPGSGREHIRNCRHSGHYNFIVIGKEYIYHNDKGNEKKNMREKVTLLVKSWHRITENGGRGHERTRAVTRSPKEVIEEFIARQGKGKSVVK